MITYAYALFDSKVGIFGVPFFTPHRGQAIRMVTDLGSDLNTTVGRHPADYSLVEIGQYDDASAAFIATQHVHLGTVQSLLPDRQQPLFDATTGPLNRA